MSRRSRGRSRFERRKAHAVITKGRPGLVATAEAVLDKPLEPFQKRILEVVEEEVQHHALSSVPVRSGCPVCGLSQKVKRDATMGLHTVTTETPGVRRVCEGTGRKWND